jgi:hypothetical protein
MVDPGVPYMPVAFESFHLAISFFLVANSAALAKLYAFVFRPRARAVTRKNSSFEKAAIASS